MVRRDKTTIFIDRDLNNPFKGWGWIDIEVEVVKRLGISMKMPQTRVLPPEEIDKLWAKGKTCTTDIRPPSRGRSGGKKFVVNTNEEFINLSVQKSLTTDAVCAWVKSWVSPDAKIITPGGRTISIEGEPIAKGSVTNQYGLYCF